MELEGVSILRAGSTPLTREIAVIPRLTGYHLLGAMTLSGYPRVYSTAISQHFPSTAGKLHNILGKLTQAR